MASTELRAAAQQALEAMESADFDPHSSDAIYKAIIALTAALEADDGMYGATALTVAYENGWNAAKAKPVQEPVALDWLHKWANQDDGEPETQWHEGYEAARRVVQIHLTAPPQRNPLTEEEALDIARTFGAQPWPPGSCVAFARAIERAHGIGGQP